VFDPQKRQDFFAIFLGASGKGSLRVRFADAGRLLVQFTLYFCLWKYIFVRYSHFTSITMPYSQHPIPCAILEFHDKNPTAKVAGQSTPLSRAQRRDPPPVQRLSPTLIAGWMHVRR
jgi:hypothetical protein